MDFKSLFSNCTQKYKLIILDFLVFLWTFEIIHTVLRFYVLIRPTVYNSPFVSKFEWYFFHAIAIDFTWLFYLLLVLFFVASFFPKKYLKIKTVIFISQIVLVILSLLDHEVMRHLNWHMSLNLFSTYTNSPSLNQVITSFLNDSPFPFSSIPVLTLAIFLFFKLPKIVETKIKLNTTKTLIVSILFLLICWSYRNIIWKGGFREERLKPVIHIVYDELTTTKSKTKASSFEKGKEVFQKNWFKIQTDSLWTFADSSYAFVRTPLHELCQQKSSSFCLQDRDKDGFPLTTDCHDWDPSINPNAKDVASNGVDEDCSGIDKKPWNFAIFFLESHRALNAGFLKPYGATTDGTPFLNKISKHPNAHIWSRFSLSGTPTIGALMATHLGIWNHPFKHITTGFSHLHNRSFVNILRDKGYLTNFFSSPDPAWDNQIPWLQKWYGRYVYDRSRENDKDMYTHLTQWMLDSLSTDKPFLISSITKVNHFPFNAVNGIKPHTSSESHLQRMLKTMVYTENALNDLFSKIKNEPWFKNTVFIFVADHGFFLGERGLGGPSGGLYSPLTWLPFLMFGDHPELKKAHYNFPGSQIDIAPTILDLVGIKTKAHLAGHSLLQPSTSKQTSIFMHDNASLELDSLKFHCNHKINNKNEIYNTIKDPLELNNLWDSSMSSIYKKTCESLFSIDSLITYTYEHNLLWEE